MTLENSSFDLPTAKSQLLKSIKRVSENKRYIIDHFHALKEAE